VAAVSGQSSAPAAGTYQLAVARSGMCLDVPGGSRASGVLLQQWGCTPGAAWQEFRLVAQGGSQYRLVNVQSGLCVDVPGGSLTSGVQLQQWGCGAGQANQLWTVTAAREGTFQIVSVATGLCISDKGASLASGGAVIQETCTANSNKRWTFTPTSSTPPATPTSTAIGTATSTTSSAQATVAADGTGKYRTVQAAIDAVPSGNTAPVTITIKPATYREKVTVPADKPYITLQGTGTSSSDVVIVDNRNAGDYGGHVGSATVVGQGHDFHATNLTISNDFDENTPNNGAQALALYLDSDRAILRNVRLLGDQDTLLVNNSARAYVVDSYVEGTVDFIYGGGIAVFSGCTIHEKRTTGGPITAASTDPARPYGFLFYRSTITGNGAGTTGLGRPWRQGAQVVYRESSMSADVATAQPWSDMGSATWKQARYFEYLNTGAGATLNSNRPQLTAAQAAGYTPKTYLAGNDGWDPTGAETSSTTATASTSASTSSARQWSNTADGFASTAGGTTGGAAGHTVTVSTFADLVKYATAADPYVVRVAGAITVTPYGYEIPVTSNKTLIGVGATGQLVNGGLFLAPGTHNVIIRNLTIRDTRMPDDDPDDKVYDYDGIQMDTADHVWIDHNTIVRMNDGLIDSRKDTSFLTVSWNVLGQDNKAFGIGWTDHVTARITIHHNWIHDTNQRNPSVDNVALAHLYNNYLQNITSYGNLSRGSSKTVIENSYYDNVKNPYYPDTSAAALTQSGSIVANSTGRTQTSGTTFTPSSYYAYALDPAKDVPALVKTYAGPQPNIG
jgi:pectin methylesterase-like acyl-CoA thioesterase/pectate lyase